MAKKIFPIKNCLACSKDFKQILIGQRICTPCNNRNNHIGEYSTVNSNGRQGSAGERFKRSQTWDNNDSF